MTPPPQDDAELERTQDDALECEQQALENQFREREIAIKEGELKLKFTEQEDLKTQATRTGKSIPDSRNHRKEEELKLKEKEYNRARWYNSPIFPLVLAIVGAIFTGGFGVLTTCRCRWPKVGAEALASSGPKI